MSVVLRVIFLRRGFILAVLKDAGTMPEVREELIIEVRNGRMSLETSWRREEGIASRGQLVAWIDVIILLTSSGLEWKGQRESRRRRGRIAECLKIHL